MKRAQYEVNFRDGRKVNVVADKSELKFKNGRIEKLIIKIMLGKEREMLVFPFEKIESYKGKLINEEEYIEEKGAKEWTIKTF